MTHFTVEYQDSVGYQDSREVESGSPREAAAKVVESDNLSYAESQDLQLRVYESGSPESDKFFSAEKFI